MELLPEAGPGKPILRELCAWPLQGVNGDTGTIELGPMGTFRVSSARRGLRKRSPFASLLESHPMLPTKITLTDFGGRVAPILLLG